MWRSIEVIERIKFGDSEDFVVWRVILILKWSYTFFCDKEIKKLFAILLIEDNEIWHKSFIFQRIEIDSDEFDNCEIWNVGDDGIAEDFKFEENFNIL